MIYNKCWAKCLEAGLVSALGVGAKNAGKHDETELQLVT
jgi:hypothetical protein